MTYQLILGDYAYSSWSLRGWLLFEKFGIPRQTKILDFASQTSVATQLADYFPARTVPTLKTPEGAIISESLAIGEELATRHPDANIWPKDAAARATARTMVSEMHAGFLALRADCPMNLRTAYQDAAPSADVLDDLARLDVIWTHVREQFGGDGPWLCGQYSAADAFFAPVAARIAGYNLPVSDVAQAYVETTLADLAFRRWRAMGLVRGATLTRYAKNFETVEWPGPEVRPATVAPNGPSVNTTCPYSGDPVTDYLDMNGVTYGFCNPFCRDKTLADPEAWPAFIDIVDATTS